jgi:hypothetical protein
MARLVVGDVVNVLGDVGIDSLQFFGEEFITASCWLFAVLDSAQFVVLFVKVGKCCLAEGFLSVALI